MNLQRLFNEAWARAEKDGTQNVTKNEAMHWFYAGAASQKQIQPSIRSSDLVVITKKRKQKDFPDYREAGIDPDTRYRRFFLDLIRQMNHMLDTEVSLDEKDIYDAISYLAKMEKDRIRLNGTFTANVLSGTTRRYAQYSGATEFFGLVERLRNKDAQS